MTDFASAVKWDILPYIYGEGLDIGCGDARPFDWLVGVDIKPGTGPKGPNQLRDARKLAGYFADESQDYLFSSHLLNELEDWPTVLASWWRLLKPNGYLIVFLPVTDKCGPKQLVDAMAGNRPWQMVDARVNGAAFIQVYRKCEGEPVVQPPHDKICAVMKLGAHGDALWASSVFPHLKEQGFYTKLYCQETTEEVLRHDPHIDEIVRFESRLPMGQLGELFQWLEAKYKHVRILVECVEGTLLPSPQKIQYHFPQPLRHKAMNFNYLEFHHLKAEVPYIPRQKFYPSDAEKVEANAFRATLKSNLVVLVPNGSSVSKMWPYAGELAKYILRRNDSSVVVLGDLRGFTYEAHPDLHVIGTSWDMRRAMTLAQLANIVVGQETGLVNSVAFEAEIKKIVLLSHSSVENLTRDWPNTVSIRKVPPCAGKSDVPGDAGCHRLHYDWTYCNKHEATGAALCQSMISCFEVLQHVEDALPKFQAAA